MQSCGRAGCDRAACTCHHNASAFNDLTQKIDIRRHRRTTEQIVDFDIAQRADQIFACCQISNRRQDAGAYRKATEQTRQFLALLLIDFRFGYDDLTNTEILD